MSVTTAAQPALNGARKAAVFTVLLGEECSAEVFKFPRRRRSSRLRARSPAWAACTPTSARKSSKSSTTCGRRSEYVARGGVDYAQKLLVKSLGPEMAKRLVDWLVKSFESTIVFTALEKPIAAAVEVHPGGVASDHRAHPRASQAGPGGTARRPAARRRAGGRDHPDGQSRRNLARSDHPHLVGHRAAA